jgi:ADP-heptose:LPS heptosyltransferase
MSYRSILIIKPSSLGDIVHTLPAVSAIREANRDAEITWVINPEWAPLLRGTATSITCTSFRAASSVVSARRASMLPWLKKTRALRPDAAVRRSRSPA